MEAYLQLDSSHTGTDRHRVAFSFVLILSRFSEGLIESKSFIPEVVLPSLKLFYPNHHVQMPLGVLLDHIADIIRLSGLLKHLSDKKSSVYLEFPPSNKIFYLANGSNGILMHFSQLANAKMDVNVEKFVLRNS